MLAVSIKGEGATNPVGASLVSEGDRSGAAGNTGAESAGVMGWMVVSAACTEATAELSGTSEWKSRAGFSSADWRTSMGTCGSGTRVGERSTTASGEGTDTASPLVSAGAVIATGAFTGSWARTASVVSSVAASLPFPLAVLSAVALRIRGLTTLATAVSSPLSVCVASAEVLRRAATLRRGETFFDGRVSAVKLASAG